MGEGPCEVEVKFRVADAAALAGRLEAAGALVVEPRVRETNSLFDDAEGSLYGRTMLLRLRQDRRARLTLKAPVKDHAAASDMKVREELEVEVDDAARMQQILDRLGYRPTFAYEKYRTTYRRGACTLMLDETPIGTFLEIEGGPAEAREAAAALGLDWQDRLVEGYATLFARVRARLGWTARDMTFEAVGDVNVPPDALR